MSFRISEILICKLVDGIHAVNQFTPRSAIHALGIVEIQNRSAFRPEGHARVLVG